MHCTTNETQPESAPPVRAHNRKKRLLVVAMAIVIVVLGIVYCIECIPLPFITRLAPGDYLQYTDAQAIEHIRHMYTDRKPNNLFTTTYQSLLSCNEFYVDTSDTFRNANLYLHNGTRRQLLARNVFTYAVSNNDRFVVYSAWHSSNGQSSRARRVYLMEIGKPARLLYEAPEAVNIHCASVSNDGGMVLFRAGGRILCFDDTHPAAQQPIQLHQKEDVNNNERHYIKLNYSGNQVQIIGEDGAFSYHQGGEVYQFMAPGYQVSFLGDDFHIVNLLSYVAYRFPTENLDDTPFLAKKDEWDTYSLYRYRHGHAPVALADNLTHYTALISQDNTVATAYTTQGLVQIPLQGEGAQHTLVCPLQGLVQGYYRPDFFVSADGRTVYYWKENTAAAGQTLMKWKRGQAEEEIMVLTASDTFSDGTLRRYGRRTYVDTYSEWSPFIVTSDNGDYLMIADILADVPGEGNGYPHKTVKKISVYHPARGLTEIATGVGHASNIDDNGCFYFDIVEQAKEATLPPGQYYYDGEKITPVEALG